MIVLRLICAVLLAWAVNWVLSQPVAAELLEEFPEMVYIGPATGALVGFLVVLGRRESGLVIATANGAWAGILLIALSGFAFLTMKLWDAFSHNLLDDFEAFLRVLGTEARPFTEVGVNPKLIAFTVGAASVPSQGRATTGRTRHSPHR